MNPAERIPKKLKITTRWSELARLAVAVAAILVASVDIGVAAGSIERVECNSVSFTSYEFSHCTHSFLTDEIIRLRYEEIDGLLRKVLVVVKMCGVNYSKDLREYVSTDKGVVVIGPRQPDYVCLTSGLPERIGQTPPEPKAKSMK